MKKVLQFIFIFSSVLLLSGCIDVVHVLSLDNGELDLSIKYTIQKSIFEMAGSMSEEKIDYSEFLTLGEEKFEAFNGLSAEISTFETPLDIGIDVSLEGDLYDITIIVGEPYHFIPRWKGGMYEVTIPCMNDGDSDESDAYGLAFLSSARYRLLIDLNGDFRGISKVKLRVNEDSIDGEEVVSIDFYDNMLLIEIPMIFLFASEEDIVVQLIKS